MGKGNDLFQNSQVCPFKEVKYEQSLEYGQGENHTAMQEKRVLEWEKLGPKAHS